jgi:anti-sigma-K factor RskA
MDYARPALADRLAAEYVAGTLRGPARRRFETLLGAHPGLRAALQGWEERLIPLAVSVAPKQPPTRVWRRIQERLWRDAKVVPADTWWRGLAFWRGLAVMASVAVVSLTVLLAVPPVSQAPIVVVLSPSAPAGGVTTVSLVASISADGRAMVTRPLAPLNVRPDRTLELWAMPSAGAPRSLGLISADATTVLRRDRLPQGTVALAVSLEPAGGSPTGAPTGPVLYTGKIAL